MSDDLAVAQLDEPAVEPAPATSGPAGVTHLLGSLRRNRGGLHPLAGWLLVAIAAVGFLVSTAGLDPKRVEEGIAVIVLEYAKIAGSKPQITKKELEKAKEFLKGHFVLELEDSRAVAAFFAQGEILEEKIDASMSNGVLTVHVPKADEAKPRTIKIVAK